MAPHATGKPGTSGKTPEKLIKKPTAVRNSRMIELLTAAEYSIDYGCTSRPLLTDFTPLVELAYATALSAAACVLTLPVRVTFP